MECWILHALNYHYQGLSDSGWQNNIYHSYNSYTVQRISTQHLVHHLVIFSLLKRRVSFTVLLVISRKIYLAENKFNCQIYIYIFFTSQKVWHRCENCLTQFLLHFTVFRIGKTQNVYLQLTTHYHKYNK